MAFEYLENIGDSIKILDGSDNQFLNRLKDFTELKIGLAKQYLLEDPERQATGALSQSIEPVFTVEDGEVEVDILANDYWDFINSGVNGVQRQFGSEYSFKSLNPSPDMVDALAGTGSELGGWMKTKNITELVYYDNSLQEFVRKELVTDADYKSAAFVFARAIKRHGIEPNNFMDRAFNEETLNQFDELILDAIENRL